MTAFIKLRVTRSTPAHVYASVFEAEASYLPDATFAKVGDLVFSREGYWPFRDALERGRGGRTQVIFEGEEHIAASRP